MPAEPDCHREFFKQTVLSVARTLILATVLLAAVVYVM